MIAPRCGKIKTPMQCQDQDEVQRGMVLTVDLTSLRNFPNSQWNLVLQATTMSFTPSAQCA